MVDSYEILELRWGDHVVHYIFDYRSEKQFMNEVIQYIKYKRFFTKRDLMRVFGITYNRARYIISRLHKAGYIKKATKKINKKLNIPWKFSVYEFVRGFDAEWESL